MISDLLVLEHTTRRDPLSFQLLRREVGLAEFIDLLRALVLGEVSEKKVLLVARQASLAELALVAVLVDLCDHIERVLPDR